MVSDYLVRAIAKEAGIRVLACVTTGVANEGTRRHATQGGASLILSDALTGVALLGATLKVRQRIAMKYAGNGPLGKIVVESDAYGKVRGYVLNPEWATPGEFEPLLLTHTIGDGLMTVVKDVRLRDLIESTVELVDGTIAENIAGYLNQSEQVPSLIEIGSILGEGGSVHMAGGLLVQSLPRADAAEVVDRLREVMGELPPVVQMLENGQSPSGIISAVLGGIEYEIIEERPIVFECSCSRTRSEQALITLGRSELESLIAEGGTRVECHFCHERYEFEVADLYELLDRMSQVDDEEDDS